jgi:hypothetical protein
LPPSNRRRELTWNDIDGAALRHKPRLLLELIVGRLAESGCLPPGRGLTVRELIQAARLSEAADREGLAEVALAAEQVRFSDVELPAENIESAVDSGRKLLERMTARGIP